MDAEASDTEDTLKLWHPRLVGRRKEAISVYTDHDVVKSQADLDAVIAAMDAPENGLLPAFCFAVKQVAMRLKA